MGRICEGCNKLKEKIQILEEKIEQLTCDHVNLNNDVRDVEGDVEELKDKDMYKEPVDDPEGRLWELEKLTEETTAKIQRMKDTFKKQIDEIEGRLVSLSNDMDANSNFNTYRN